MIIKAIIFQTLLVGILYSQIPDNTLSPVEIRDNYQLLFNGINFEGWKTYGSYAPPQGWQIKTDGNSSALEIISGARQHLFTQNKNYMNFDLKISWKVPPGGNSGIFIRYLESVSDWGGLSGPEAQVVDISHSDGLKIGSNAGACYDLIPIQSGLENWFNPTNEWNEFRIIAFNNKIAHYGNGKKLLEYEIGSPEWTNAYTTSKYQSFPLYGDIHPGAIYLQHHGETGIQYKNIRIKPLEANQNPWAIGSPYLKQNQTDLVDEMSHLISLFPNSNLDVFKRDPLQGGWIKKKSQNIWSINIPLNGELFISNSSGKIIQKIFINNGIETLLTTQLYSPGFYHLWMRNEGFSKNLGTLDFSR